MKKSLLFFCALLLIFLHNQLFSQIKTWPEIHSVLEPIIWNELQPAGNYNTGWYTTSMSSDGSIILSGVQDGRLYISSNVGNNWNEIQPAGNYDKKWYTSSMSSDGSRIIAGVAGVGSGRLYISTNSGSSWTETLPAGNVETNWCKTAMSADGLRIVAGVSGGRLYISSNGGLSWTETRPAGDVNKIWRTISMSSDGSWIIAGTEPGRLYISTNGGNSWTETQPAGNTDQNWFTTSISQDGSKLIAGVLQGRLYLSTDGGNTWTETQPAGNTNLRWYTSSMSSDGSKIIVGPVPGRLYISTDGGSSWSETQPSGNADRSWAATSMSSDGSKIIAGAYSGRLYMYQRESANPAITITSPNGGENWQAGTQQSITWTSNDVTNVKLEYTTDNGSNWTTIIANTPASTGSYLWIVPNSASTNCKIRISDIINNSIFDETDNLFTISTNIPKWIIYNSSNSGLPDDRINSIVIDRNGVKWFGTERSGLVKFDGKNWEIYNKSNSGLPDNHIYSLAVDKTNKLWIGTSSGSIVEFNGLNWKSHQYDISIYSLKIDKNEMKWFGSRYGLVEFNGTNSNIYSIPSSNPPDNEIRSLAVDVNNDKWVGTWNLGILKFDGTNWTKYDISKLPSSLIHVIEIDKNETKWIGTNSGLARFDGNNWNVYNYANSGFPFFSTVRSIAIDSVGNKWIGTGGGGLVKYDNNKMTVFNTSNSDIPDNHVYSIAIDELGNKWIGTDSCLVVYMDGENIVVKNIIVTQPNGGESWKAGTQQNITWTSSGVTNVKLEYSTNNGASWNTIISSTPAGTLNYSWTVPNISSTSCKVKISDADDESINSVSAGTFTIFATSVWTEIQPAGDTDGGWLTTSMSSDGTKIIAGSWDRQIFVSTNSGNSWNHILKVNNCHTTSMSSDGSKMIAGEFSGGLYISTDSGNTWIETQPAGNVDKCWLMTSMSSDGSYILAGEGNGGRLYISTNSGNSWVETQPDGDMNHFWNTTSISSDGTKMIAGGNRLYKSTSSGNYWIETQPAGNVDITWNTTSISSDGTKMIAGGNRLYISTSSGTSWTETRPAGSVDRNWITTFMSSDGIIIIAGELNGRLYISTNGGTSWTETQPAGNVDKTWNTTSMSSDGSKMIAGVNGGRLYTSLPSMVTKSISVHSPVGGESWQAGTQQNITWTSTGVDNVKLEYTTDNGSTWQTIISSVPASSGSYLWTIPNTPSSQCKIRISDVSDAAMSDVSDNTFTIPSATNPFLSVISPNGGENWQIGTPQNISWSGNQVTDVKIEYTTDNGSSWQTIIASRPASTGSYLWTVPNTPSNNCKVRISDVSNSLVYDESDIVFTISQVAVSASITVTSPNGGNIYKVGEQRNITWTSSNVANVKIECIENNSITYIISSNTPAITGSYSWIINNTPSTSCKIKISDVANSSVFDESDNSFQITYPASISVTLNKDFGDATKLNNYRMIGLPGAIDVPISSTLNGSYPNDWKAGWDNGAASNYMVKYDQSSNFNFRPGKAFWIISSQPLNFNGTVNSVALQQEEGIYSITVHYGWNLISSPFEKEINWSGVQQLNGIPSGDQLYDFAGSYFSTMVFAPYKGYYFYNRNNLIELKLPYVPPSNSLPKANYSLSKSSEEEKQICIKLIRGIEESSSIMIKFDKSSKTGLDDNDIFYPPGDFESIALKLRNDNLESPYKYLTEETRPQDIEGDEFSVELKNQTTESIKLKSSFSNIDEEIYLMDYHGKLINLKQDKEAAVEPSAKQNISYKVLVGSIEYINRKQQEMMPKEYGLSQNYPNPFNPQTVIAYQIPVGAHVELKVYDILGREIITLVNEEKEAGYYKAAFDAKALSSGIYFYRISTSGFSQTKKMILQK